MPTIFHGERAKGRGAESQGEAVVTRTLMTPLTSFAVSPEGVRFETQEDEEQVVLFIRQHLVTMIGPALLVALLAISPIVIFPLLFQYLVLPIEIPARYIVVGTAFWYVATFGFALMSFLRWFFNIYIVTNKRIVDIDFLHLLYKEFSEARLERIQDISFKSGGIFAAFFDYGDIDIQTAAEVPNIEFAAIPKPAKVVETISALLERHKEA